MTHPIVAKGVGLLRRGTPPALVPTIVRIRTRRALADPEQRERARAEMAFLLGHTQPDADLDAVGARYLERWAWRAEVRWRPSMITHQRIEGVERLLEARSRGRGVILNFMHHAQYEGAFPSLARRGVSSHVLVHPAMLRPDAPEHLKQHLRIATMFCAAHSVEIGTPGITDLLRSGGVVSIASDVPGSTEVTFAGRRVRGSSGAARMAMSTGAPVLLLTSHHESDDAWVEIGEPLEPTDFEDAEALLDAIVAGHEPAVLSWPEAVDSPRSRWGPVEAPEVQKRA